MIKEEAKMLITFLAGHIAITLLVIILTKYLKKKFLASRVIWLWGMLPAHVLLSITGQGLFSSNRFRGLQTVAEEKYSTSGVCFSEGRLIFINNLTEGIEQIESHAWSYGDMISLKSIVIALWIVGMIFVLTVSLLRFLSRMWKLISERSFLYNYECFRVFEVNGENIACIIGSDIYIGKNLAADKWKSEKIIYHEICHYRRRDFLWNGISCIYLAVGWFLPTSWMAASMFRNDCDIICDQYAVGNGSTDDRKAYCNMMLEMGISRNQIIGLNFSSSYYEMKERVENVLNPPKNQSLFATLAIAFGALVIVVCASVSKIWFVPNASRLPEAEEVKIVGADVEDDCLRVHLENYSNRYYAIYERKIEGFNGDTWKTIYRVQKKEGEISYGVLPNDEWDMQYDGIDGQLHEIARNDNLLWVKSISEDVKLGGQYRKYRVVYVITDEVKPLQYKAVQAEILY